MLIAAAVATFALAAAVWHLVLGMRIEATHLNIQERVSLYKGTIQRAVDRFAYLPHVLSRDPRIDSLLQDKANPALINETNWLLADFAATSGAAVLYVLDAAGNTIASSNWNEELSFVGRNYAFRPYFLDAMRYGSGRFYGVGVTTGEAGHFLSARVGPAHRPLGVVTVKISLAPLQREWQAANESVLLADENGIVFLSSRPEWAYRAFQAVSSDVLRHARETHQYGETDLARPPLFGRRSSTEKATILGKSADGAEAPFLIAEDTLADHHWTVAVLSDFGEINKAAGLAAAVAALSLAVLLLASIVWAQRRATIRAKLLAHDLLERNVADRTRDLVLANEQLALEINQRERAEIHLRQTQDDLIHAGKLAALGHMSAAISHEINQPLAALRTYLSSTVTLARQSRQDLVIQNIERMQALLVRIADIVTHLKRFARHDTSEQGVCEICTVLRNALELVESRLDGEGVELTISEPRTPVFVSGTGGRLEQVLVNLLNNAMDAMQSSALRKIDLRVTASETEVTVEIEDTGSGIHPGHEDLVFAPFFTTKDVGTGLGLGLSISHTIITSFGGTLKMQAAASGGARFTVALRVAPQNSITALEAAE